MSASETDPRREPSPPTPAPGGGRSRANTHTDAPSDHDPEAPVAADSAPVADPSGFRLRGDPPRVMRLSRKVLGAGAVLGAIGIGAAFMVALQTRDRQPPEPTELHGSERRAVAEQVTGAPRDYSQVPQLGEPLPGDLGRPILNARADGRDVPVPPMGRGAGQARQLTPEEEARQREIQALEAAIASGLFHGAQGAPARSQGSAGSASLPPLPGLDPVRAEVQADPAPQDSARAFLAEPTDRQIASPDRLAAPMSPHVVMAGSVITAALITGLRSDLPGQVTAQVTSHVYDTPTGQTLLIPQGARLIGEYDSSVAFGQRRVLLVWTRLILPDGRSIVLERQPAGDAAGQAGLEDGVDHHWDELAKAAGLSTLLSLGTELATDSQDRLVRALQDGGQDTFNQAGQEIVRRQLNIPPTLTVRPGYPVNVLVSRDLTLEPWRDLR